MTEKRFTMKVECGYDESLIQDADGDLLHIVDACELLNEQHETIQQLKAELKNLRRLVNEAYMEGSE